MVIGKFRQKTAGFNGGTSLPLAPYFAPGDPDLAHAVRALASSHHAVLLANHGPEVAGTSLAKAQFATE
ncbi:MAG: class II aldolase/adducin family protein [Phyllobacteriaceae bacterium]|nr:class II aldolase/adducin family protein [Phyllobacteriaceae bacterium]